MMSPQEFLHELRLRGAERLRRVSFRHNRSTLWSLTQDARVLNVHAAYKEVPADLIEDFATLVREGGIRSAASRCAARRIGSWPAVRSALEKARRARKIAPSGACCAIPEQARYLKALYRYFNATRFGGALPDDVPVRLSSRMVSALGHMLPAESPAGERRVAEIALNVDLMLEGNGAERIDTLLHEMAHAADYLESGGRGHGISWRQWARRVGCRPSRLHDRPLRRRGGDVVTRVPPLPPALLSFLDERSAALDRTLAVGVAQVSGQSQPNVPAVRRA
jgi:hypothetical protein